VHNAKPCINAIKGTAEAIKNRVHQISKKYPNHTKMIENAIKKGHPT
jgi:hypothetical protein